MGIRRDLLARLKRDEWASGDQLPTESRLAEEYEVSRATIRKALKALVAQGYLVQRQGAGTFVTDSWRTSHVQGRHTHVILPNADPSFTLELLIGVQEGISEEGLQSIFLCSDESGAQEEALVDRAIEAGTTGIILFPLGGFHSYSAASKAIERGIPLVLVDRYLPGIDAVHVVSDNVAAGRLVADHLLAQGCRRPVVAVNSYPYPTSVLDRLRGLHERFDRAGAFLRPEWVLHGEAGGEMLERLFAADEPPDAVVAENDLLALEVIRRLRYLGLGVPNDVSVMGFGDRESRLAIPYLSSIAQHPRRMGGVAGEYLAMLIRGAEPPERRYTLPVELKARVSTGAKSSGLTVANLS